MGCSFYFQGLSVWDAGMGTTKAFMSQISYYEKLVGCPCGIEEFDGSGDYEIDRDQLIRFTIALSSFSRNDDIHARLLKKGINLLCLALLSATGGWPEELSVHFSPEMIDLARFCEWTHMSPGNSRSER